MFETHKMHWIPSTPGKSPECNLGCLTREAGSAIIHLDIYTFW